MPSGNCCCDVFHGCTTHKSRHWLSGVSIRPYSSPSFVCSYGMFTETQGLLRESTKDATLLTSFHLLLPSQLCFWFERVVSSCRFMLILLVPPIILSLLCHVTPFKFLKGLVIKKIQVSKHSCQEIFLPQALCSGIDAWIWASNSSWVKPQRWICK